MTNAERFLNAYAQCEKKLAEFQQKHSVVTTIILNIPRLPEEGVLNAEKK